MRTRRLVIYLTLGFVLGLLLTACAGAAVGQAHETTAGPSLFGPVIDTLSLPVLAQSQAPEANAMRSMGLERAAEQLLQTQQEMMLYGFGGCDRADHYFDGDDG
jgi:hypothetical protein